MKMVCVEWEDSHTIEGWKNVNDLKKAEDVDSLSCVTVGILLADNDRAVRVASSLANSANSDDEDLQYCGIMTIPRKAIKKITEVMVIG